MLRKSNLWMSYLFKLEDVLVEVVLETFVGEVDAELLETVVLIVLKTKNIQHSDGQDLWRTDTRHNDGTFNIWTILSI